MTELHEDSDPTIHARCRVGEMLIHGVLTKHYDTNQESQILIVDLLSDVMHYCTANEVDFQEVVSSATHHHKKEQAGKL